MEMKMKKGIMALLFAVSSLYSQAQTSIEGSEIGFDGSFSASTFGGNAGIGIKYGLKTSENFIFGPSIRIQRNWWKNLGGAQGGFTNFGGGMFAHYRYANYLFGGAEFEVINTQLWNNPLGVGKKWIPTFFVGGGFSREFDEKFRLNAGVFYDILNNQNSPFRAGYVLKNSQGIPLPVIYRIGLFIPL
jgi:hypothetical protein